MAQYDDNRVIPIGLGDGTVCNFTVVASGIQYHGKNYSLLQPADSRLVKMKDNEVIVCSVKTKNGKNIYSIEGNSSRSSAVLKIYNKSVGVHYSLGESIGDFAKKAGRGLMLIIKIIIAIVGAVIALAGIIAFFESEGIGLKIFCIVLAVIGIALLIAMIRSIIKQRR